MRKHQDKSVRLFPFAQVIRKLVWGIKDIECPMRCLFGKAEDA